MLPESVTCVLHLGARSNCHVNAVTLWRSGEAVAIGTGYALSDDQLWREHSWAWDRDGYLIETTEPRNRYYGLRMDGPRAERFANWMAPLDDETPADAARTSDPVPRALTESAANSEDPPDTSVRHVTHGKPVWRDRANYIIQVELASHGMGAGIYEQLWTRTLDNELFEVCCLP